MKATTISIIIALVLIGGAFMLSKGSGSTQPAANANNVSIVDGKQIIEITAKGGYQPRKSIAKAGIPTVIRFNTSGTFDCSSSISIPSLGISKILPQTGSTDIDIGSPTVATLQGTCGMGMYPFEVDFQG
jgi:plastocyanin domain-containing protein